MRLSLRCWSAWSYINKYRLNYINKVLFVLVLVSASLFVIFALPRLLLTDLEEHAAMGMCPACYGQTLCSQLGHVRLNGWGRFHHLNTLFNVKNVFFGHLGSRSIVLKKHAHDAELIAVDKLICSHNISRHTCSFDKDCGPMTLPDGCSIPTSAYHVAAGLTGFTPQLVKGLAPMTYCPTQRLLDRITAKYMGHRPGRASSVFTRAEIMTLLYTLMVNAEPLILQTFPAVEGWPFPQYIGACGRLTVQTYSGRTVADLFDADWQTRVDIAWQIMKIADQFTDNAHGFRLLWTDLDLSNLALDDEGHVVVIDPEDIYVVDVQQIFEDKPKGWLTPQTHEHEKCLSCLSFDPDIFCSRADTDLNYYTACRALSQHGVDAYDHKGGLLHDPPKEVDSEDVELLKLLLQECVDPVRPNGRAKVKDQLTNLLAELSGKSS